MSKEVAVRAGLAKCESEARYPAMIIGVVDLLSALNPL